MEKLEKVKAEKTVKIEEVNRSSVANFFDVAYKSTDTGGRYYLNPQEVNK